MSEHKHRKGCGADGNNVYQNYECYGISAAMEKKQ